MEAVSTTILRLLIKMKSINNESGEREHKNQTSDQENASYLDTKRIHWITQGETNYRYEITLFEEIAKGRKMTCRKQSADIKERDTDKEWFKEANIILERRGWLYREKRRYFDWPQVVTQSSLVSIDLRLIFKF